MQFRVHENGLHYFNPRGKAFTFFNTVSKNMKTPTKRLIKNGEVAIQIYKTLAYPSKKDFIWVVQSHQINNCPVTVQNVDDSIKIWGKYLDALKGNTTRSKPNIVARDQIKFPINILKLH